MTEYVVSGLLWVAGIFTLIAAIGLIRLPDVLMRMHASTKAGTVGVISSLLALSLYFEDPATRIRALLIALFLCITAPIVAHVLSRASLVARVPLSQRMEYNDWKRDKMSPEPDEDDDTPPKAG